MSSTDLSTDLIIPKESLVLVTGVNGYIASHVADQLLERGYHVRGTVRDADKATWLNSLFQKRHPKGSFELVGVSDYQKPGAFEDILKDVSGVVHTVGVISLTPDPNDVITPTVAIVNNLLNAMLTHRSVKSFVFTSSSAAIALPIPNTIFPVNAKVFNEAALSIAWAPPPYTPDRSFQVYAASKLESEYAIRKFVDDKKPGFRTASVFPSTTLGEILDPANQDGSTAGFVTGFYTGKTGFWSGLGPGPFVNTQDVARLHVAALVLPNVEEGERVLGFAGVFSQTDVLGILRKLEPGKQFKSDPEGEGKDISDIDNKRSEALLREVNNGEGWTSLEETVKENVKHLKG